MLTKKQLEAAARKLCALRGLDADANIRSNYVKQWEVVANEILEWMQVQGVIDEVLRADNGEYSIPIHPKEDWGRTLIAKKPQADI